jgi:hypothetical protein
MIAFGDILESFLRFFGVTKEQVTAFTGKPCKCQERQAAMNRWGFALQRRSLRPIARLYGTIQAMRRGEAANRLRAARHHAAIAVQILFRGL